VSSPLVPLGTDPAAARRFSRRALEVRAGDGREPNDWAAEFERRLDAGTVDGRLWAPRGPAEGLASWSPGGPLGAAVHLIYSAAEGQRPSDYAEILTAVETEAGPLAFLSGPLAGLTVEAEDGVMLPLGFRRFGRSEMVLEASPPPSLPALPVPGEELRRVDRTDLPSLVVLHRAAYHDRFDRYLFMEDPDEAEDAHRGVSEILDGRWGEFEPAGSWLLLREGRPVGAVLSVHTPAGTLIADVAVAPELQGAGVGRRVLGRAVDALRAERGGRIYLNVTEGNERALRLYRRLGFVRSLGPTRDWYNAARFGNGVRPDA
jgi:ribosomal protein S18 acetylase RimI-like enzyme